MTRIKQEVLMVRPLDREVILALHEAIQDVVSEHEIHPAALAHALSVEIVWVFNLFRGVLPRARIEAGMEALVVDLRAHLQETLETPDLKEPTGRAVAPTSNTIH